MDKILISKYINGRCTFAEEQYILNYFKNNPDDINLYFDEDEWKDLINTSENADLSSLHSDKLFQNIYHQTIQKSHRSKKLFQYTLSFVVFFVFCIGFFYWKQIKFSTNETLLSNVSSRPKLDLVLWQNHSSQIAIKILPDGSKVTLYPNSTLSYMLRLDTATRRNMTLVGKALFEVKHDTKRPFTVLCTSIATTALGTKFEVDGKQQDIKISLFEGKVVVQKPNDPSIGKQYLYPGEKLSYKLAQNQFSKKESFTYLVQNSKTISEKSSIGKENVVMLNLADVLENWSYTFKIKVGYKVDFIHRFKISDKDSKSIRSWPEAVQFLEKEYQLHQSIDSAGIHQIR